VTTFAALDHRFELRCDHQILDGHLRRILSPLADDDFRGPAPAYEVRVTDGPGTFALLFAGEAVTVSADPSRPVAHLLHHVNATAIAASRSRTLLHAAAAAAPGGAVLLPAAMEAGKSTLVTGLARRGLAYLSDEIAAIDPATRYLHPFPRAISLDPGAWSVFPDLAPEVDPQLEPFLPPQWQVPPDRIGPVATRPVAVAAVVSHRYERDATTQLVELEPVECLRRLLECDFTLCDHEERDVRLLARLVDGSRCLELVVGDLDEACDLVIGALDDIPGC
jgi:hypothetical protein